MALRVPINLASEPFRRDRPLLVGSAALAIVLTLLLIFQVFTIVSERHQAADIRVAIDRENARLQAIASQQAKLNAQLRRPENAEVLERSLFLNTLIERKAISWTKIFADLEKVMPYNVRLVSVRLPEVDSQQPGFARHGGGRERCSAHPGFAEAPGRPRRSLAPPACNPRRRLRKPIPSIAITSR